MREDSPATGITIQLKFIKFSYVKTGISLYFDLDIDVHRGGANYLR